MLWIPSTRNLPWNCSARGTHRNCTETALNLLKLEIQTSKHYLLWDRHETVPEPPQNRSVSRTRKKINQEKTAPRAELERHFSLTARPAEYGHYEHPTPEQKTGISHRKETNKSRINQCVDVWIYDGHISGGGGWGVGRGCLFEAYWNVRDVVIHHHGNAACMFACSRVMSRSLLNSPAKIYIYFCVFRRLYLVVMKGQEAGQADSPLKLPWNCPETARKLLGNCPEIALKLLWNCSAPTTASTP